MSATSTRKKKGKPQRSSHGVSRHNRDEAGGFANWIRGIIKTSPAVAFSALFHFVLVMGLGIATIATVQRKPELVLTATSLEADSDQAEDFSELEIESVEDISMDETEFDAPAPDMAEVEVTDVELPVTEALSTVASPATGAPAMNPSTGKAPNRPSKERKKAKRIVQFAGTAAQGNRFAFIVDNSLSMVDGKMLATIDQLLRSIKQMTPKQEFYVVFYSDEAYPMFYPESASTFVPASKANVRKLQEWLKTIEINYGGNYEDALNLVFDLQPDAIFLLGDGGGVGEEEQRLLTGFNPRRKCVINTIGVGAKRKGAEALMGIAQVNGGQFRQFPTPPGFMQMYRAGTRFPVNRTKATSWSKKAKK